MFLGQNVHGVLAKLKIIVSRKVVRIKGSRILSPLTSWRKIFTRVKYNLYEKYYMANNIVKKKDFKIASKTKFSTKFLIKKTILNFQVFTNPSRILLPYSSIPQRENLKLKYLLRVFKNFLANNAIETIIFVPNNFYR